MARLVLDRARLTKSFRDFCDEISGLSQGLCIGHIRT